MADRSFGPAALGGLAAGALAAVAGNRDWVEPSRFESPVPTEILWEQFPGVAQMPLSGALGLVVLACWGVLLVSRGTWRRAVAWLSLAASLGLLATWVTGLLTLQDDVVSTLVEEAGRGSYAVGWTSWFWAALVAALGSVGATAVAALRVGRWPAMGSRYDAPGARAADGAPRGSSPADDPADGPRDGLAQGPVQQDAGDLWKALDEGRDPTGDGPP